MKNIYVSGDTECTGQVRDFFNRKVRPEINEFALDYFGEVFQFEDLWFKREEVTEGAPLATALERLQNIDFRFPYIVILGEEYGIVPEGEAIDEAIAELDGNDVLINLLNEYRGRSITEMELGLAAYGFGNKNTLDFESRTLFLMYPQSKDPGQEALKNRIKADFDQGSIINLAEFGDEPFESQELKDVIITHFIRMITDGFAPRSTTSFDEEIDLHRALGKKFSKLAVCRKDFAQQLVQILYDNEDEGEATDFLYICGKAGTGKTCLLSLVADEIEKTYEVCRIFCGRSIDSDSGVGVAETITYWLSQRIKDYEYDLSDDIFVELNMVNELYSLDGDTDTVYIVLDGIDRLRPDDAAMLLKFLPIETFGKIKFIVSGRLSEEDFKKRYYKFVPHGGVKIDAVQLGDFSKDEICQVLESALSHRCAVSSAAERIALHLEKLGTMTPLIASLCAKSVAEADEATLCLLQQEHECSDVVDAYIKLLDGILIGANGRVISQDSMLYRAVAEIFTEDDMRVFCIAVSKHGLTAGTLNHSFGFGHEELDFYQRLRGYRNLLFERCDGLIDFCYDGFREVFANRMTREYISYCHKMLKSCYFETELQFEKKLNWGMLYHAVLSYDYELLYLLVLNCSVHNNDTLKIQIEKRRNLTVIARILRDFSPKRFSDSEDVVGLPVGFLKFCETYLFKSYSGSPTDSRNCSAMLYEVAKIYADRYEDALFRSYDADRVPKIVGYHADAPDEMTVNETALCRSHLVLLGYQLNVLEKLEEYSQNALWKRNGISEDYDRMKEDLATQFVTVADSYLAMLPRSSEFSDVKEFYNKFVSGINNAKQSGCLSSLLKNEDYKNIDYCDELLKRLEGINPSQRSLRFAIINRLVTAAIKLTDLVRDNTVNYDPSTILPTLEAFFNSIEMNGSGIGIAEDLSVYFHSTIEALVKSGPNIDALFELCDRMIDFSLRYIELCGDRAFAFDNINYCLALFETWLDVDTPEKFNALKERYFKVADFLIGLYTKREFTKSCSIFEALSYNTFFGDMQKTFSNYSEVMGDAFAKEDTEICRRCFEFSLNSFKAKEYTADYFDYYLNFGNLLKYAALLYQKCESYNLRPELKELVKLELMKAVDGILNTFEEREAMSGDVTRLKKLCTDFITGITEDETYKLLVEDLESLFRYVEERDELDEEVLILSRWNWRRKNIVVIE